MLLESGKLESALARSGALAYYEQADVHLQAATLLGGIALAHAFLDGNKRLAITCGVVFLHRQGIRVVADPKELGDQVLLLLNRTVSLREATLSCAAWLRTHTG